MKIVIVGGGKLGYYLSRNLIEKGHTISLIEKNKTRCIKIAEDLDIEVICGDGTEIKTLLDANISKADAFVSVSGVDQDNLVACQLVKEKFFIDKVIARANNPRNVEVMHELGIESVVSSTDIITEMIEQEINNDNIKFLTKLSSSKFSMFSIIIPYNSTMKNIKIKDLTLPNSTIIVSVMRAEEMIVPQGDTDLFGEDELIILCRSEDRDKVEEIFFKTN